MAISATYITLQRQVADEIGGRTDLLSPLSGSSLTLSPVQNAIQSAIAKWERTPFYFNETYNASLFSTANGTELYTSVSAAAIATLANIHRLHIAGTTRYPLIRLSPSEMDDMATTSTAARPTHFSYFASTIRFYPIPDAIYAIAASYTARLSALSADADANAWTQDAFDLIKAEAKLILALEVLHDSELAVRMKLAIYGDPQDIRTKGYLQALLDETERRCRYRDSRAVDDPTGSLSLRAA